MNPTKNDLPKPAREKLAALLNARLADAIDLRLQIKHAHWNVKGPSFIALHELFDKVAASIDEYADELAERAVQLGASAEGRIAVVAKAGMLAAYPSSLTRESQHVEAVSKALAAFGKSVRAAIDKADDLGDADSADLFTEVSRGTDKWLWLVESHNLGR